MLHYRFFRGFGFVLLAGFVVCFASGCGTDDNEPKRSVKDQEFHEEQQDKATEMPSQDVKVPGRDSPVRSGS
jgi:hypothetical protein